MASKPLYMYLESILLSKVNQTEKDKYHRISCTWNNDITNDTNVLIYKKKKRNRLTDIENKLMVTNGESGGVINWASRIKRYTLLNIK